jgi:hypothetical protein
LFRIAFTTIGILMTAGAFKPTESKTILQDRDYPSWLFLPWMETSPSLSAPRFMCICAAVGREKNQLLLLGRKDWDLRLTSHVLRLELHFSIPFWRNTFPLGCRSFIVVLLPFSSQCDANWSWENQSDEDSGNHGYTGRRWEKVTLSFRSEWQNSDNIVLTQVILRIFVL